MGRQEPLSGGVCRQIVRGCGHGRHSEAVEQLVAHVGDERGRPLHPLAIERPPQAAGEDRRQPPQGDAGVDPVATAVARGHEQLHRLRIAGPQRGGQPRQSARHVAGTEHDEPVGPGADPAQFQRRHGGDPAESDW
jgi:hypothetical protein